MVGVLAAVCFFQVTSFFEGEAKKNAVAKNPAT